MDNIEIIKARKLLEKTQTFSTITTKSTVYNVNLTVYPVLNTTYENIGSKTNNGITFNPTTIFLNEKSAPGEVTADGDYYINYITGRIRVKSGANAAGGVTLTYYVSEQYNYLDADQASVYQTTAYAASGVIKNSAGSFYGLFGYNSKTSDQYLQLHNATSVPADTAVPLAVIAIPAESTFSIDCQTVGIPFSTGIVWCNSSTAPTKTIGSADVFLTALYL